MGEVRYIIREILILLEIRFFLGPYVNTEKNDKNISTSGPHVFHKIIIMITLGY